MVLYKLFHMKYACLLIGTKGSENIDQDSRGPGIEDSSVSFSLDPLFSGE